MPFNEVVVASGERAPPLRSRLMIDYDAQIVVQRKVRHGANATGDMTDCPAGLRCIEGSASQLILAEIV